MGAWLSRLVRENYDNRAAIAQLARRSPPPAIVIFHGLADRLIPARMSRALAKQAPAPVTLHLVPGAAHDNIGSVAADEIVAAMGGRNGEP